MATQDAIARNVCSGVLVRVARHRLEAVHLFTTGYVLACSKRLVLLQTLTDRIDLDGFEVLRMSDITGATDQFARQEFYQRALELKRIRPMANTPVEVSDLPQTVEFISAAYPLLSVSRERTHPDELTVGRVSMVKRTGFFLQWITPSAVLEDEQRFERFAGITRLQFGAEYENTLALVAGLIPPN